jgi:hypothetical protein
MTTSGTPAFLMSMSQPTFGAGGRFWM